MARPVRITTPISTLEEFGAALGLSKRRQRSLNPIFVEQRPQGGYAVKRRGSQKTIQTLATQKEAVEKARELNPGRMILVRRVRSGARGASESWRKA